MEFIKRHLNYIKKAVFFILETWLFCMTSAMLAYWQVERYPEILECKEVNLGPDVFIEFTKSFSKLFLIAYVLFACFPDKIRKAKWWVRAIYFTMFYVFCCLVYLWI